MTKQVTIYDIALALNTSASTVSRALSNDKGISEKTRSRFRQKQSNGLSPECLRKQLAGRGIRLPISRK